MAEAGGSNPIDEVLEKILVEVLACVRQVSVESLTQAGALIESAPRIFVAGTGRSGLGIRAFGMRLMHLGKTAYVVGETTTPSIAAENLLILASGSGRTSSLLAMAERARRQGAKILLFTTDTASPLAGLADQQVVIPAPVLKAAKGVDGPRSVQPMGTLFEQALLILCDGLILGLMQRTGVGATQMAERHANLE